MPRLSPIDDFNRTLSKIHGSLPRLIYLAELRHDGLQHRHWGMEHVYGSERSRAVMEKAHTALLQHVLSTPLRVLVGDAEEWIRQDRVAALKYLGNWQKYLEASISSTAKAGARKHLKSVLLALSILLKDHCRNEKDS